ncbi:MAG: transcription-repair coupling factor [Burkholderiaceae bacterium]
MPIPGLIGKIQWPKPGATFALPTGYGSSDALQLAALASREDRSGTLTILSASAVDAQRLHEEIGFFAPALTTRLFPDWEILPYDVLSPHQDLVSERLATLYSLHREDVDILICPVTTAVHRLAPPAFLSSTTFYFDKGAVLNEAGLRKQLTHAGYEHVSQVVRPGEYSVRGGLIDLFPMGAELPFRLDLFGDEIESIRTFNPESQRSLYPVQNVRLLPAREVPTDEASRNNFRNRWRERFEGDPSRCALYKDIANGIFGAGIEYYLPLFHEETADIFHYLPEGSTIVFHGDVSETIDDFLTDAKSRYSFLSHDAERPLLKPTEVFLTGEEFFGEVKRFGRINISARPSTDLIGASDQAGPDSPPGQTPSVPLDSSSGVPTPYAMALPDVSVDRRAASPVSRIHALIQTRRQQPAQSMARILVMAESEGRLETLVQLFGEYELKLPVKSSWADWADSADIAAMVVGPLHDGFHCDDGLVTLITEAELFTGSARRARRGKREATTDVNAIIRDLSELKIGDPVVHIEHGIGRYEGLIDMDIGEGTMEFLHLTYAKESMLYVPVSQLHLISRYSGANPDEAPLHQLGSGQWEKARKKAAKQARDTAAELLNLYARRAARVGHAFEFSASDYAAFADGFGFEETPDQLAAIHAVVQDMISDKPMDRLVCGDVGFGKTEVALRAAFLAVSGGRQVVLLAPTTLLAEQHFATFSDRFAHWPIKVAQLSRFRSGKEIKAALAGLADGSVDIVIGTHKLLSSDVKLKRLGLAIIDEEHRFGVRQKERLKALRAEVDVLTLTATPIPRTLAMSLEGIRDFSVIATAPQRRLAIKTFVRPEARSVVREALLRELKRGGQVYYLHNEVQTINTRRDTLAELVPEARIAVAHGQMGERDLERVMRDFHQQRFNVLLCTTIIETGIDVPTANTIVIHRADKFGLAQLHQLRGRVGRSHHQAYAYLLTPHEGGITRDAGKRLEAIQSMEELGAGFFLSMHDLEIRGSGEVLGDNQSGDMQQIGFSLYAEMLDEAVRSLKAGKEPDLEAPLASTTEINLHMPALLPADYCPDIHERLTLYKRLANCSDDDALIRMSEELIDRFGRLPEPARALVDTHRLRVLSRPIGVNKIDASEQAIVIQFIAQPPIEPSAIIAFMQSRKDTRLAGADRIRVSVESPDLQQRVQRIREIISALKREAESADKTDATDKTDETK